MAHLTLRFQVEMEMSVPDELAAHLSVEDVCDSVSCVVAVGGEGRVVMGGDLTPARFRWSIRPPHGDVTPADVELFTLPGDGFARLDAEPHGAAC